MSVKTSGLYHPFLDVTLVLEGIGDAFRESDSQSLKEVAKYPQNLEALREAIYQGLRGYIERKSGAGYTIISPVFSELGVTQERLQNFEERQLVKARKAIEQYEKGEPIDLTFMYLGSREMVIVPALSEV